MKKVLVVIVLGVISLIGFVYVLNFYFSAKGNAKALELIQSIRHGLTKEEVRKQLSRDPMSLPANTLPDWIREVAPEKEKGEYWYFPVGNPPKILIIYFDENGKAVFTT